MSDFFTMRQNMVKCQILPENVTNPRLIEAFLKIPREKFVPRQLAHIAYMDSNFPFNVGRVLLRPATLARILEALDPKPSDNILYIAGGTGYGAAILSWLVSHVVALDSEDILTREAERLVEELNLSSVEVVYGPLQEGWDKEAPYDKMIIEGSIGEIPESLDLQLKEEGEIITFKHCKIHGSEVIKYVKKGGVFTEIPLFDAYAPPLEPFHGVKDFVFE